MPSRLYSEALGPQGAWQAAASRVPKLAFAGFMTYSLDVPSGETVRPERSFALGRLRCKIAELRMATKDNDPALPRLALLYGSLEKRTWTLARDAITIGRARGCDIPLEAPDVSSLHCLVWRHQGGLSVRDCGSRAGTHLNGDRIVEATLHDRDILQIGPFSFMISVPVAKTAGSSVLEARCRRLERSRRGLARLALAYRARLRDWQQLSESGSADFDVHRKASGLRRRFRDFEQRLRELEDAERDVSRDRELLDCELRERLGRLQNAERDLEQRKQQFGTAGQLSPESV